MADGRFGYLWLPFCARRNSCAWWAGRKLCRCSIWRGHTLSDTGTKALPEAAPGVDCRRGWLSKRVTIHIGSGETDGTVGAVCMVWPIEILPAAEAELRRHVEVVGSVPRSQIVLQYAWADVFVLPSICEGSATVTHEALAAGLPVVCTPNTGSVVQDGIDRFIVPVRRSDSIAQKLDLLRNEDFLACMSENARARAAEFTLNEYSERLIAAIVDANARDG